MKIRADVSQYKDYVKALVVKRYWSLPEYVRASIDIEDCIQDGLLYLHRALNGIDGFTVKYEKDKSKLTTWVFTIVNSYFNALLKTHTRKKRYTVMISLDALNLQIGHYEQTTALVRLHEAIDKVRELHILSSPELVDFLAANFYNRTSDRVQILHTPKDFKYEPNRYTKGIRKIKLTKREILLNRKIEFRQLAKRLGVTMQDYKLASGIGR